MNEQYPYAEHRFRFAAWAAARAVKKLSVPSSKKPNKLTGILTDILREALFGKRAGEGDWQLKDEILGDDWILRIEYSDTKHASWRKHICELATKKGIIHVDPKETIMSHGQAAKLINIFIKALMPSDMSKVSDELQKLWGEVHPPIDRIMLEAMDSKEFGGKKDWGKVPWTKLKCKQYQELIDNIRYHDKPKPSWKTERFWKL